MPKQSVTVLPSVRTLAPIVDQHYEKSYYVGVNNEPQYDEKTLYCIYEVLGLSGVLHVSFRIRTS